MVSLFQSQTIAQVSQSQVVPSGGSSFLDANGGLEDLSASFRTLYKNMFEGTQGKNSVDLMEFMNVLLYRSMKHNIVGNCVIVCVRPNMEI